MPSAISPNSGQLPSVSSVDSRARLQEATTTQNNLDSQAISNASAIFSANQAMTLLLSGLPPPLSAGGTALTKGIYKVFKSKPRPLDIQRAQRKTGFPEELIDPAKLFASMLAFAIIEAIWCFIKSILHPLPFIGWFFSLCDPEGSEPAGKIKDAQGNIVDDVDQIRLNSAKEKFNDEVSPGIIDANALSSADIESPIAAPTPSSGKTFQQFMEEKYPQANTPSVISNGLPDLGINTQTTNNNSANNSSDNLPGQRIEYQVGNLSSDQVRRLFGL